jgi:hypothetical protein
MSRKINEIIRYIIYRTTKGHLGTFSRTGYPTTLVTSCAKTTPRRPVDGLDPLVDDEEEETDEEV